jgi:hypothetical protein
VRRLRIVGVLVLTIFAVLALSIALENPGSSANAQSHSPSSTAAAGASAAATPASASTAPALVAWNKIPPTIVASNLGVRTLSAAPQPNESVSKLSSPFAATGAADQLLLTSVDKPNKLFSFSVPGVSNVTIAAAASAASRLTAIAGIGAIGSIGDGGAATAAQFDLNFDDITVRSGVAVAPDGTTYIADSGNATIRMIAGPASSEPGIIRSVAGRWAPRQNLELSEPLGLALDRAGNLFIADSGANAIDVLYGVASPKAGQLETLAHMVAPASVAVTLDGGTVFASSAQTGVILAINTKTSAIRTLAIDPATIFAATQQGASASSARIAPTGLAVDGGSNLFIAYADPGAAYDEIFRVDAFSAKVTLAARGLSSPGDISFDAKGNLFVANQGIRNVVRFNALGVAALGVTLTAPVGTCTDSATLFCDQLIGGTSPTQSFELTNNTAAEISGISSSFLTGDTTDFTVASSSCGTTLAANASCAFNIAFTPTANAPAFQTNDGATCATSVTANSRCSAFTVNYTGATAPLVSAVTGIADDFQIVCVVSTSTSCVDLPDSNFDQTTILQGGFATFQLQITPDNTFSGPVSLVCPSNLPVSPAGTVGSPTTCGLSLGTTVSEPLQPSLTVNVVAGTPLAFNMTIQTTTSLGTQTPPPATTPPAATRRGFSPLSLLAGGANGGGKGSGPSSRGAVAPSLHAASSIAMRFLMLLAVCSLFVFSLSRRETFFRKHPALAIVALALIIGAAAGCGGSSTSKGTIPFTPTGTYTLTVQGSAQGGARGYTCTLIVASGT